MISPDSVQHSSETLCIRSLAGTCRALGAQPDPAQAIWHLLCTLREELGLDRAGVFAYDRHSRTLHRVAGVDRRGEPEYEGDTIVVGEERAPLVDVARRILPYYFSDDAPRDYPGNRFGPGVRALAVIPIVGGNEFLGALCADNCLSGRPMSETLLDSLFVYAGLAALPLFALYQRKEQERLDALRHDISREMLFAVTGGKIRLCDQDEIDEEWPSLDTPIVVDREGQVRAVREAVRACAVEAGMEVERAEDLALCASEAATNALLHGRGGHAAVGHCEGKIRVRITDSGQGIDPHDLPRATLMKGWSKAASMGLGFTIINETADRLYLHTGPRGTSVIIEMSVKPELNLPDECNPLLWGEPLSM